MAIEQQAEGLCQVNEFERFLLNSNSSYVDGLFTFDVPQFESLEEIDMWKAFVTWERTADRSSDVTLPCFKLANTAHSIKELATRANAFCSHMPSKIDRAFFSRWEVNSDMRSYACLALENIQAETTKLHGCCHYLQERF